jgi:acyl-CoA synthetase (AMP-forming)/AMP-acid ligase II
MTQIRTVHGLLEAAAGRCPDGPALHDDARLLTFGDWWRVARHMAALLSDAGVGRGHLVGAVADRSALLPCLFTAVSLTGARFVALDPGWSSEDRERVFERWSGRLVACAKGMPRPDNLGGRLLEFGEEVFQGNRVPPVEPPDGEDDDLYLNVTSASTGQAKVAPTTHRQLISNTVGVCSTLGLTERDVHLSLFGVSGHPHELFMRGLYLGGLTVLTEKRFPRDLLAVMEERGVTAVMALPTQFGGLAKIWGRPGQSPPAVRMAEAGGMHVSREFAEAFVEQTGVGLIPVWGSTETSGVVLVGDPGLDGFSRVVDGYSVEVRDSGSARVQDGASGELWVSGPGVVDRYQGDRLQTEEAFVGGWYRTGDMFSLTDGRMCFLGRRGGLIKAVGVKVFPLEVELAILRHPGVEDVCVVAVDHPVRGEMPSAWIVPKPGVELGAAGMREFLRGLLDDHKIPRLFHFVNDLPRTASGKIDRKAVGVREVAIDIRGELLRSDVELVRLLNHRAGLMAASIGGFDPGRVDEQEDNAVGHNAGPASDSSIRNIIRFIIHELGKG